MTMVRVSPREPTLATGAPLEVPGVPVHERRHSRVHQLPLAAPREGVMIHYDDSTRDDWAVAWFSDTRCTNGYTWLVLDNGNVIELADPAMRTPHAGACLTPNANSCFYGVSAATNGLVPATTEQLSAIVAICAALFNYHGWPSGEAPQRIRAHCDEAIWTRALTRSAGIPEARAKSLWGRTGRKADPTGCRPDGIPIIDINQLRLAVQAALNEQESL